MKMGSRRAASGFEPRGGILVLDLSYTFADLEGREAFHTVESHNLSGFYKAVWLCHPFEDATLRDGRAQDQSISVRSPSPSTHFVSVTAGLAHRPVMRLVVSQVRLFMYLRKLIRREKIVMIKATDPFYLGALGWLLGRSTATPLIIRIGGDYDAFHHTLGKPVMPRLLRYVWLERALQRFTLSRAQGVVAANERYRDYAVTNGADGETTVVVSYGVLLDPQFFERPESVKMPKPPWDGLASSTRQSVVCISRLEPVKQVEEVIAAFAEIVRARPQTQLILIGEGSLDDYLKKQTSVLGIEDRVLLAGSRAQSWVHQALLHADVVLSALSGRALSEACLSEAPVVAYDQDWQSELIIEAKTGRLIDNGNFTEMARAALELLEDSPSARRLGRAAREHALSQLDRGVDRGKERQLAESLLGSTPEP